ncbi:ribosome maturation factor RimM [soil metagenome]
MGEIGKPHGIDGEVYMVAISDDPHRFDPGSRLEHADGALLVVEGSHTHRGNRLLVKFEGVDSRNAAELIRGPVYVREEQRRDLEEGEYWQHELVGCRVFTVAGNDVGEVSGVVEGPAQDLISVDHEGQTFLVPLVKEIAVDIDIDARRVTIAPPAGLLD